MRHRRAWDEYDRLAWLLGLLAVLAGAYVTMEVIW